MASKLRITLRRSPIGCIANQKATARALGFKKLQQTVEHTDNPAIRGMIHTIRHLVEVETVSEDTPA